MKVPGSVADQPSDAATAGFVDDAACRRAGDSIEAYFDIGEFLRQIAIAAPAFQGVEGAWLWLADPVSRTFRRLVSSMLEDSFPFDRMPYEGTLLGWVAEHREILHVPDVFADDRVRSIDWWRRQGLTSYLGIPLISRGEFLGVLAMHGRAPFRFDPRDLELIENAAAQAATAVRIAKLLAASERARSTADALARIGRDLAESLDVGAVAQRIAESLRAILGVQAAVVYRRQPVTGALIAIAVSGGLLPRPGELEFPEGYGAVGLAATERRLIVSDDILADERISLTAESRDFLARSPSRAILAAPLIFLDRVIGGLGVGDLAGRVFDDGDLDVMRAFADQATLVLRNAEVLQEARARQARLEERSVKLTALSAITQRIAALSDPRAMFAAIATEAATLVHARRVEVWVDSASERCLRALGCFDVTGDAAVDPATMPTVPHGDSLVWEVLQSREAQYRVDIQIEPRWANAEAAARPDLRAWAGIPLVARGRAVGVLSILLAERRRFTQEERDLVSLLADHGAIAISNQQAAAGLRQAEAQLAQAQKLESIGQLAAGVAHELNTPIQFVGDNVRFLETAFSDFCGLLGAYKGLVGADGQVDSAVLDEVRRREADVDVDYLVSEVPSAIDQTIEGVGRVATIVRALKEFAHPDQKDKTATDLNQGLLSTLTVARNEVKYVADVETDLGTLPLVVCHPGEINQVLLNLIVNAAHAIGDVVAGTADRGRIRVTTAHEGDTVLITITDTGGGIPPAIQSRIFDPFFTTKGVGRGTGQGLAIARNVVVDKHGGALSFETENGRGTTFFIRLPVGEQKAPAGRDA